MPTSQALTTTNSPCYFLGPFDLIGSFRARCSTATTSTTEVPVSSTATSTAEATPSVEGEGEAEGEEGGEEDGVEGETNDEQTSDTTSESETEMATTPGLQSTPTSGAPSALSPPRNPEWYGWVDVGIRALMAMGAVEVAWGWGML